MYFNITLLILFVMRYIQCSNAGDGESCNSSRGAKTAKRLIRYSTMIPHKVELTDNLKRLLTEKELRLEELGKSYHSWPEFNKLPLEGNQEHWENLCNLLWPGLEKFDGYRRRCIAELHPYRPLGSRETSHLSRHQAHYKCYFHDQGPLIESNQEPSYIKADLLSCECGYIKNIRAMNGSRRYFFALKFSDVEYFLLSHVNSRSSDDYMKLMINDFVKIEKAQQ